MILIFFALTLLAIPFLKVVGAILLAVLLQVQEPTYLNVMGPIAFYAFGIAFIMQYVASGYAWADERFHFDPQRMIAAGVLLAVALLLVLWPLLQSMGLAAPHA